MLGIHNHHSVLDITQNLGTYEPFEHELQQAKQHSLTGPHLSTSRLPPRRQPVGLWDKNLGDEDDPYLQQLFPSKAPPIVSEPKPLAKCQDRNLSGEACLAENTTTLSPCLPKSVGKTHGVPSTLHISSPDNNLDNCSTRPSPTQQTPSAPSQPCAAISFDDLFSNSSPLTVTQKNVSCPGPGPVIGAGRVSEPLPTEMASAMSPCTHSVGEQQQELWRTGLFSDIFDVPASIASPFAIPDLQESESEWACITLHPAEVSTGEGHIKEIFECSQRTLLSLCSPWIG